MATIAAGAVLVVATGHLMGGLHYPVFASEGTWVSDELGSTLTLLPGWSPIAVPTAVTLIGTVVCWASLLRMGAWATQPGTSFLAPLWFTLGGLVLMTALLWLASDRYILAFLPPAIALVLGRGAEVSWRRGTLCLALFAAVAAVAVRDRTAAEQAVWKAVADLRRQGVAVSQIDAGYVVNGWLQFAHPEHAARDGRGQVSVPFVNGDESLPWIVAAAPLPGSEIVRVYRFERAFREPGRVLVLKRH